MQVCVIEDKRRMGAWLLALLLCLPAMAAAATLDPAVLPRVQAATSSGKPVLLRVDYDAGHGLGSSTSQREALTADLWSFALWQMGDPAFQPAAH